MNNVSLVGRLTADPELRSTHSGDAVAQMRLAVDGRGEADTLYIDVVSFGKGAEACVEYLAKGREVAVSGRLVLREWEAQDGSKRSRHEVVGRVEFLGPKPQGAAEPASVGGDDEIPF